jgi:hypothetical protein
MATPQAASGALLPPKMISDMKFVGMFQIVYGALACLSIVGALVGIPMLMSGLRLRDSADAYTNYQTTPDPNWLQRAFQHQSGFFNLQKIVAIITIVMMVIGILFYAAVIAALVSSGMRHRQF